MSVNQDPQQQAYQQLQEFLRDSHKRRVFGPGGLFGYRKENHEVLKMFVEYARTMTKDDGSISPFLNSEGFAQYLENLPNLDENRKKELTKNIRFLALPNQNQIEDKPPANNTLRNFAITLYHLGIWQDTSRIIIQYELAIEKALNLEVLGATRVSDQQSAAISAEQSAATANSQAKTSSSQSANSSTVSPDSTMSSGTSADADSSSASTTDDTASTSDDSDVHLEADHNETQEIHAEVTQQAPIEATNEEDPEAEETEEEPVQAAIPTTFSVKKSAKPKINQESEDLQSLPSEDDKDGDQNEENDEDETDEENAQQNYASSSPTSTPIQGTTPSYQRFALPRKSAGRSGQHAKQKPRKIERVSSPLGNLRQQQKPATQRANTQNTQAQQQNSPDQQAENQQPQNRQQPGNQSFTNPLKPRKKSRIGRRTFVAASTFMGIPLLGTGTAKAAVIATTIPHLIDTHIHTIHHILKWIF